MRISKSGLERVFVAGGFGGRPLAVLPGRAGCCTDAMDVASVGAADAGAGAVAEAGIGGSAIVVGVVAESRGLVGAASVLVCELGTE